MLHPTSGDRTWACARCNCCWQQWVAAAPSTLSLILKKQRQNLQDLKVTVTGEREKDVAPCAAHRHSCATSRLFGDIDADKAGKAVSLSVEKYCSVAKTLEKTAKVTYSFEITK